MGRHTRTAISMGSQPELMPKQPCIEPGCPRFAEAKGRCGPHRRAYERERSVERRGGYQRGPYSGATAARDADEGYRYPKRESASGKGLRRARTDSRQHVALLRMRPGSARGKAD